MNEMQANQNAIKELSAEMNADKPWIAVARAAGRQVPQWITFLNTEKEHGENCGCKSFDDCPAREVES